MVMMDLCGRAVQELARAWKDDSEILPWLKQLATSNDDGLSAGPPFRKARKFASLEPAFAINRCNIVNTRYTRKKRRICLSVRQAFLDFNARSGRDLIKTLMLDDTSDTLVGQKERYLRLFGNSSRPTPTPLIAETPRVWRLFSPMTPRSRTREMSLKAGPRLRQT